MRIAITDPMRDEAERQSYARWLGRFLPEAQLVFLSHAGDNLSAITGCNGLVLSGGGDVHPKFYHHPEAERVSRGVSEDRDRFEFGVIHAALEWRLPVLGICRGAQIFNVAMGGTLIPDIEQAGHPSHGKRPDGEERTHAIDLERGSMLHDIIGSNEGNVNSYHHQAVGEPGRNLWITARSADGVAEAIEWIEPAGRSPLIMVQWHPERMKDASDPFSATLVHEFARAMRVHNNVEHR